MDIRTSLAFNDLNLSSMGTDTTVTSMLVTDVGDQMCWWQDLDVGDKSRHQHQISVTNITFWHIMMLVTDWNVTVIVTTGVEPFGFDHSPFRRTDLKPTRFEVVSDKPPLVSHSENLWSRANFDLYYFNKNYIFNIPSHYSRLSFREPLGGIIWVSHNCNKWCCRSLKYFCNSFDFKRSLIRSHAHQN